MDIGELKQHLEDLRMSSFEDKLPVELVPCNEVSDASRLCANPLVSVLMTTYNHADNIRSAIEAVMRQTTDFPYELVVGEDASTDGTREICFEMQRKYPDRIRVLWSEHNVFAEHGNSRRVLRAARGEFFAYCEGDDRWLDPNKLQRQVDLMRASPNIGICLGGTEVESVEEGRIDPFPWHGGEVRLFGGEEFIRAFLGMVKLKNFCYKGLYFQTSGYLIRRSSLSAAKLRFPEAFLWRWLFGDIILLTTVAMVSDVALLCECVSRYRFTTTNISSTLGEALILDGEIYKIYLCVRGLGLGLECALDGEARRLRSVLGRVLAQRPGKFQSEVARKIETSPSLRRLFDLPGYCLILPFLRHAALTRRRWKLVYHIGLICDKLFKKS